VSGPRPPCAAAGSQLQILHPLDLVRLQATEDSRAPPVIGDVRDADRPHRVDHRLALRDQHINLPELRGRSPPACNASLPSAFSILSEDIPKGGPLQRGRIRPPTGLARPAHQPAGASRRSPPACNASLPSALLHPVRKTYLRADHFKGGGSPAACARAGHRQLWIDSAGSPQFALG